MQAAVLYDQHEHETFELRGSGNAKIDPQLLFDTHARGHFACRNKNKRITGLVLRQKCKLNRPVLHSARAVKREN